MGRKRERRKREREKEERKRELEGKERDSPDVSLHPAALVVGAYEPGGGASSIMYQVPGREGEEELTSEGGLCHNSLWGGGELHPSPPVHKYRLSSMFNICMGESADRVLCGCMHGGMIVKSDTQGNLIEKHMLKDGKDNTHVRVHQKVQQSAQL